MYWKKYNIWNHFQEGEELVIYAKNSQHPHKGKFFRLDEKYREEYESMLQLAIDGINTKKDLMRVKVFAEKVKHSSSCWVSEQEKAEKVHAKTMCILSTCHNLNPFEYMGKRKQPIETITVPGDKLDRVRNTTKSVWNGKRFVDVVY